MPLVTEDEISKNIMSTSPVTVQHLVIHFKPWLDKVSIIIIYMWDCVMLSVLKIWHTYFYWRCLANTIHLIPVCGIHDSWDIFLCPCKCPALKIRIGTYLIQLNSTQQHLYQNSCKNGVQIKNFLWHLICCFVMLINLLVFTYFMDGAGEEDIFGDTEEASQSQQE